MLEIAIIIVFIVAILILLGIELRIFKPLAENLVNGNVYSAGATQRFIAQEFTGTNQSPYKTLTTDQMEYMDKNKKKVTAV